MKHIYDVIVGNIGRVWCGNDLNKAQGFYETYVDISKSGMGRAGNQPVQLMKDGEIYEEYEY